MSEEYIGSFCPLNPPLNQLCLSEYAPFIPSSGSLTTVMLSFNRSANGALQIDLARRNIIPVDSDS